MVSESSLYISYGKLKHACFIFDFDSTISTEETLNSLIMSGIDDIAEHTKIQRKIEEITDLGMNGELSMHQSLDARVQIREIHRNEIEKKKKDMVETITPGMKKIIKYLQKHFVPIFIISGGLIDFILPVAEHLSIPVENCFGNSFVLDQNNIVIGFDEENPLTKNHGKSTVIGKFIKPRLSNDFQLYMVGDGATDFEPFQEKVVDHFIGFGVNVNREKIEKLAIDNEQPYFKNIRDLLVYMEGMS